MADLDLSFWSSLVTFALLVAGVVATLWAEWVEENKKKVVIGFIVLGALGFTIERFQASAEAVAEAKQSKAEDDLAMALKSLSASVIEQEKAAKEAAIARARSDELVIENRKLAGDTLQRVIGDPNMPPYVRADNFKISDGKLHVRLYIVNPSPTFPVKDVVADLDTDGAKISSISQSIPPAARVALSIPNNIGLDNAYVRIDSLSEIGGIARAQITISCGAGRYMQYLGLVRVGDKAILQSTFVIRHGETKPLISKTDKGFPGDFRKWPPPLKL